MEKSAENRRLGIVSTVATYLIRGILPLYWNLLDEAGADEILAHRICWSFVFMAIVLILSKQWNLFKTDIQALWHEKKRGGLLLLASTFISMNWLGYFYCFREDSFPRWIILCKYKTSL